MSAIAALLSLAAKSNDSVDAESIGKSLRDTQSIAARARKSMFTYPVIFTPGVGDYEIAFQISKHLELQYAMFTMLTAGIDPRASCGNMYSNLSALGSEDLNTNVILDGNVTDMQAREFYDAFLALNPDYATEHPFVKSAESDDGEEDTSKEKTISKFNFKDEVKLQAANPTIIKARFLVGNNPVEIPLAIKAYPHYVGSIEFNQLMDAAIEDRRVLTRFIKLTTGEISFFKDFLFNVDRSKRDENLYKQFGRHPWYQQFLKQKTANKSKRFLLLLSEVFKPLKGFIQGSSNYLPMTSIICTVDELTMSSKMKFGFLLKDYTSQKSILKSVLNRLALLTIGVYDPVTETVTFFFNGFKEPIMVSIKEMKASGSKDTTTELVTLMNRMMSRGVI